MPRPNVSPRPVCRYYNTSRGCFAGNKCHYLHGDPSVQKYAPYEENKTCRYFSQGYCKRGRECWYKHVEPKAGESSLATSTSPSISPSSSTLPQKQPKQESKEEEDYACSICFDEKPALYGLLNGCSHAFCLTCIRRWRDPEGKGMDLTESGMHKTCPMCRTKSKFVVPSSLFFPQGDPRKAAVVENYKQSMTRVPCRYFMKSKPEKRYCPFGRDCFYQHLNEDGTPYVFTEGVDVMMRRRNRFANRNDIWDADSLQIMLEVLEGAVGLSLPDGNEEYEASNTTLEAMIAATAMENDADGSSDSGSTEICREAFNLHLGQMMRTMGHACSGSGMTTSAVDLEALLPETMTTEHDEENWDENEPFVVYTGDLRGEDADDEDDGEEEESDSYWDDLLLDPSNPSVSVVSHSTSDVEEDEDDDGYYEAFMDGPDLESESEPEESEVETETEDVQAISISAATACFASIDEKWNSPLLNDDGSQFINQPW